MLSDPTLELTKRRKCKAPTLRDSDWEPHKERIAELYLSGVLLAELQRIMDINYGFKAEQVLTFNCSTDNTTNSLLEYGNIRIAYISGDSIGTSNARR